MAKSYPLSEQQVDALNFCVEYFGERQWKERLRTFWLRAAYPGVPEVHQGVLQSLRNNYGPEWLGRLRRADIVVAEPVIEVSVPDSVMAELQGLAVHSESAQVLVDVLAGPDDDGCYAVDKAGALRFKDAVLRDPAGHLPFYRGEVLAAAEAVLNEVHQNQYEVTLTSETWDECAAEAGETDDRDVLHEREALDHDCLVSLARGKGISSASSCSADCYGLHFRADSPDEDRGHFESGSDTFYTLSVDTINGRKPTPADLEYIASAIGVIFSQPLVLQPVRSCRMG